MGQAADIDGRIGDRVRALRAARGLTLDGLAAQAEVSRAMLSRVERGESSPTAQLLARICGGLGLSLSALFAGTEASRGPLARRAEQPTWRDPETGYLRRSVSPLVADAGLDLSEIELPAGARVALDNRGAADAVQHVWVLDGSLELTLAGEALRLEAGDCLVMRLDQPVVFRNPAARPLRYAVIVARGPARP